MISDAGEHEGETVRSLCESLKAGTYPPVPPVLCSSQSRPAEPESGSSWHLADYAVAYDISDDSKREQVEKTLTDFGFCIQKWDAFTRARNRAPA